MCNSFNKIVEDDSFAAYQQVNGKGHMSRCDAYYSCKVVMVPYVITQSLGGGWIFPKRSPLLSFFRLNLNAMRERGIFARIGGSYNDRKGMPGQICKEYDGEAIGINKCFSLFGIVFAGMGLSAIIFL